MKKNKIIKCEDYRLPDTSHIIREIFQLLQYIIATNRIKNTKSQMARKYIKDVIRI